MGKKKDKDSASYNAVFEDIKRSISILDPVSFAENYLTLDSGDNLDLTSRGWKYAADMWRFVAAQAEGKNCKPIVELKGRQVGATTKAGGLSLYFASSGLYGSEANKPPMRVVHLFPTLGHVSKYTKDKLGPMMRNSQNNFIGSRSLENDPDVSGKIPEDSLSEKYFIGENRLRIDSIGKDADRIRGTTQDVAMFDECFPYDQYIEIENGKKEKIGVLYKKWLNDGPLPMVKSYNENEGVFEYKKILNAWSKGKRPLVKITCGNRDIRCTESHPFLLEDGSWIKASDLIPGDLIRTSIGTRTYVRSLKGDQLQIVLGSFLGDGNVSEFGPGTYRLKICHGIRQKEYSAWKASIFGEKIKIIKRNGFAQTPAAIFCSKFFGCRPFPSKKTTCPQWILDELDARGLAIWFMDDGSVSSGGHEASIATCSFDEASHIRMVSTLTNKWGIDCHYAFYNHKNKGVFGYIKISKSGFKKLKTIISPYIHSTMSYKILEENVAGGYQWSSDYNNYGVTPVYKISDDFLQNVYDIEVEDNHNFILCPSSSSKNVGGPIAHNCQDMSRKAIENAIKILQHAKYGGRAEGLQLFFGTPKGTGSYFWSLWNDSDQRFFQLKCSNCAEGFLLYNLEDDSWNDIWITGLELRCPHCAFHQDKREAVDGGKWVPTRLNKDGVRVVDHHQNKRYIGFHHNLMLMPIFAKEDVLKFWHKLNSNATERAWLNETLGNFYRGGGSPLTLDDIVNNALDETRGLSKSMTSTSGKTVVLGMDWGGKDDDEDSESKGDGGITKGQSYTTAVIVSVDANGVFTIENAFKLKKNHIMYHVNVVENIFNKYHVHTAVSDQAYGHQTVRYLQVDKGFKARFLGCLNNGSLGKLATYDPKYLRITVNKDMMIEEIFDMIRRGKIRFPALGPAWEQIRWLADHCTSMESSTAVKNGNVVKAYKKGSGPNDGLMALMYAVLAYKYLSTGAFKSIGQNSQTSGMPPPTMAYIPKMR